MLGKQKEQMSTPMGYLSSEMLLWTRYGAMRKLTAPPPETNFTTGLWSKQSNAPACGWQMEEEGKG